jgi:flagellar biosynthesis component FlhA
MARKARKGTDYNFAVLQPDELNELKRLVTEYVTRKQTVENEISMLKEDSKALDEEYVEKLDVKTLQHVLRVLKIESKIEHKDAYDLYTEALKDSAT